MNCLCDFFDNNNILFWIILILVVMALCRGCGGCSGTYYNDDRGNGCGCH